MLSLSRLSVRTILNAVFVTLAAALCIVLVMRMGAGWEGLGKAGCIAAISTADRAVFEAMTTLRLQRGEAQTAVLALDDPTAKLDELHKSMLARFSDAIAQAK